MRDDFLFNDSDLRQRGKGCDRKGTKKDGLRLKWQWTRVCERSWPAGSKERKDKRRTPGQVCFAKIGRFTVEAIFWHTEYEALLGYLNYGRETLRTYKKRAEDKDGEVLVTRLQAQLKAEQLLVEFYKELGTAVAVVC